MGMSFGTGMGYGMGMGFHMGIGMPPTAPAPPMAYGQPVNPIPPDYTPNQRDQTEEADIPVLNRRRTTSYMMDGNLNLLENDLSR